MKKVSILFVAIMAAVTSWAQQQTTAADGNTKADFNKYRTYTWAKPDPTAVGPAGYEIYYYEFSPSRPDPRNKMSQTDKKDQPYYYSHTTIIPARDQATNDAIKSSIDNELQGRGYRENEGSADLIVVYQVFDQKATLHGYSNSDVTNSNGATSASSTAPQQQVPQQPTSAPETETFELEPGTLMVSLIDAKTSQAVWNGFVSGMVNDRAFTSDEADLKQAVHTIFEKFRFTADKAKR
jgi:hypothetical protein